MGYSQMARCRLTLQLEEVMTLSTHSSPKQEQGSTFLVLCFWISNPLSLMKYELELTDSYFILNNLSPEKRMLQITMQGVTTPLEKRLLISVWIGSGNLQITAL